MNRTFFKGRGGGIGVSLYRSNTRIEPALRTQLASYARICLCHPLLYFIRCIHFKFELYIILTLWSLSTVLQRMASPLKANASVSLLQPSPMQINASTCRSMCTLNIGKEGVLCDVTIVCGSSEFPCHRNVLAACSPFFMAMFTSRFLLLASFCVRMQQTQYSQRRSTVTTPTPTPTPPILNVASHCC